MPRLQALSQYRVAALLILTSLFAGFAAHSAFAGPLGQGDEPAAGPEAVTTQGGNLVDYASFRFVRGPDPSVHSSTTYTTVPGASTTLFVGGGARVHIMARFSGESTCFRRTTAGTGYCSVRILINGTEMKPDAGTSFAFDSPVPGRAVGQISYHSLSMDRSALADFPGNHTITVQSAIVGSNLSHRLDDWSLVVEGIRIP